MHTPNFEDLGDGIYCIDALYTGPGIACCYLVDGGDAWALIETGTGRSVDNILAVTDHLGLDRDALRHIVPTHVHLDHAGGAGALMQHFPEATLHIHPRGLRHLVDPSRLVASARGVYGDELFDNLYGELLPVPAERAHALEDGATLMVGSRRLHIRHTRGHADHHACYYEEVTDGWFSGDMFGVSYARQRFSSGNFLMPATTPTQFDPQLYIASVQALAAKAPRRFYLTHYSALEHQGDEAELLISQLSAYAELGERDDLDLDAIESTVLDITLEHLKQRTSTTAANDELDALRMDAKLNAQGIAWWRQQR